MNQEIIPIDPESSMQLATKVATLCADIIRECSIRIGEGKKARDYLKCDGWQAIANCFGMVGSARDVEKVFDPATDQLLGFKAIGEVRRISDNHLVTTAEGFVGVDEMMWFGGKGDVWDKEKRKWIERDYKPRPEYAVRSMAQTRAVSKACANAFRFVLVLLNKQAKGKGQFATTPAEEMAVNEDEHGGARERDMVPSEERRGDLPEGKAEWRNFVCSYGTKGGPIRGKQFGEMKDSQLAWLWEKFVKLEPEVQDGNKAMVEGLKLWAASRRETQ